MIICLVFLKIWNCGQFMFLRFYRWMVWNGQSHGNHSINDYCDVMMIFCVYFFCKLDLGFSLQFCCFFSECYIMRFIIWIDCKKTAKVHIIISSQNVSSIFYWYMSIMWRPYWEPVGIYLANLRGHKMWL